MRLLGVNTLKVDSFTGCAPAYAILSHNWEDEEVTLQQLDDLDAASSLKGFKKLKNACAIAKADGYKWIWIDTCCIDKTSSAELSEAINSMFQWYQQASICYAHISDVSDVEFNRALDSRTPCFPHCRWLTRGWTLQELIAPQELRFYSQNWKRVGSKALFAQILSHATGIPPEVLKAGDVSGITVCEKMKWIGSRETTRPEDVAYCALGIFDINMPLLYGEGKEKAFRRLQEEILRVSDDPTIFLWTADLDESNEFWGLLARSPSQFKRTPMGIEGLKSIASVSDSRAVITSRGLEVSWQVAPVKDDPSKALLVAFLAHKKRIMYAILLQQMDYAGFRFARVAAHTRVHVVIAGGGTQALLCPAGPHDAAHFPLQRIHPGDTQSRQFSVKHDPVSRNLVDRQVAVGFSFDMSMHERHKVEVVCMEWDEFPGLGFKAFHLQNNLLFHRFTKNGVDLQSETGKPRLILAALNLKVSPEQCFDREKYQSESFYMVLAISPVEPTSIGTVSPFVRPQAFFLPEDYRSKPLQDWMNSYASGATFWTDYMNLTAGPYNMTVRCSFVPKMLLAEPYYQIILSVAQERVNKPIFTVDAPKFSFSNTQPETQGPDSSSFFNKPPNSGAPNSSVPNSQPNAHGPNSSPFFNRPPNARAPNSSAPNTQPNTQGPDYSSFFNPEASAFTFSKTQQSRNSDTPKPSFFNTQPNTQYSNFSSTFGSPSPGAPNFSFSNTQPNTQSPNYSFFNTQPNTQGPNFSSFFNTSQNPEARRYSFSNTQPNTQGPHFPSFFNTSPNSGAPHF